MSFEQWGYKFNGPYVSPATLAPEAGVYAIWCKTNLRWHILDVGQSEDVRDRCQNHDRTDCWEDKCQVGNLRYSAHYMPDSSETNRIRVEQDIRSRANPPCGEQ